jgi:hypothetical protein
MAACQSQPAGLHATRSGFAPLRRWFAHGVLALALACWFAPAAAEQITIETRAGETPNGKPTAVLLVNGAVAVRLAKPQSGEASLRAVSVAAALLSRAYRGGRLEFSMREEAGSRGWLLLLNGAKFLEAGDLEAKAWGVDPENLARTWQRDLSSALGLELPADDAAQVQAADVSTAPLPDEPTAADPNGLLSISSGSVGAQSGSRAGPAGTAAGIPAATRFESAYQPQPLLAAVTGNAGVEEYRMAIDSTLRWHLQQIGGETLDWQFPGAGDNQVELTPEMAGNKLVAYRAKAEGAELVSGSVQVTLATQQLSLPRENRTFFSNKPERISSPQLLYHATLPGREAGRVVFHHQNEGTAELAFALSLYNPTDAPQAVHVIRGAAPPDINTFYIGYRSAEEFWRNLNSNTGAVVVVRPRSYLTVLRQQLGCGYTASGYVKLSNLGEQPLEVVTSATAADTRRIILPSFLDEASYSVNSSPYFIREFDYNAGDPWLYLQLGARDDSANGVSLRGMYGYTHDFSVTLNNPNRHPELVFVVFRASAGEVKGQFYINGEYVTTPLIAGGEEQLLLEIPLAPGQQRELRVQAMPLNGGFYPASIILRRTRLP